MTRWLQEGGFCCCSGGRGDVHNHTKHNTEDNRKWNEQRSEGDTGGRASNRTDHAAGARAAYWASGEEEGW